MRPVSPRFAATVRGASRTVVDVYPVGLLADLRTMALMLRAVILGSREVPGVRTPSRRTVARVLAARARGFLRELPRCARRRSYWNGYLAEPESPFPDWAWTRCGHGWTRARARRDLARHVLDRAELLDRAFDEIEEG
jgi:hypothetical protein